MVVIPLTQFRRMAKSEHKLRLLESAGVDNWDFFYEAMNPGHANMNHDYEKYSKIVDDGDLDPLTIEEFMPAQKTDKPQQ